MVWSKIIPEYLMLNVLKSDGRYVDTFNVGLNATITPRIGLP